MKKISCVAYCRVSTSSKDQFNSFLAQKEFFEKYIKDHPEYELYKSKECPTGIYADRGISGTLLHREQFDKMLESAGLIIESVDYKDIPKRDSELNEVLVTYRDYICKFSKETPKYTLILVKNTSRFSRNIMITDVLRKLATVGVYVKFLDIDKSTENESDFTIIQFFQTFDEMFSRDLSRKLLAANAQSRENQILRTNRDLYGYEYHQRKSRAENNYLTIIDKEATVMKILFRLYWGCFYTDPYNFDYAEPYVDCNFDCDNCPKDKEITDKDGMGFRLILQTLNDVYKFRTRKGKPFAQQTIKHIFENEKVCGYLNNGKWDHGPLFNRNPSPKLRENYKDYLIYRPDIIPPIISIALFDRCTKKRLGKAEHFGKGGGKPSLYKGLFFCGECGSVMTHNIGNNGTGLYNCRVKKLKGRHVCNNGNIYEPQIEEILKELCEGGLSELLQQRNFLIFYTACDIIKGKIKYLQSRDLGEIEELSEKIEQNTSALAQLYKRQALSNTDTTALDTVITELEEEQPQLKAKLEKLKKKPNEFIVECENLLELCRYIIEDCESGKTTYTEKELWSFIEKFVVYSEVQAKKGKLYQRPKVTAVPVLKAEQLLTEKYGIEINPTVEEFDTFGLENDKENFLIQLKQKYEDLKTELDTFKIL